VATIHVVLVKERSIPGAAGTRMDDRRVCALNDFEALGLEYQTKEHVFAIKEESLIEQRR